jgi:hypothetical protein
MQILEPRVAQDFIEMRVNLPWNELVDQNVVLQGAFDAGGKLDYVFPTRIMILKHFTKEKRIAQALSWRF